MAPKKRKAAKLQPISEASPAKQDVGPSGVQELLQDTLDRMEQEVDLRCQEIIAAAGNMATSLRTDGEKQVMKLAKKVRELPVSKLLELEDSETSGSISMEFIISRLQQLMSGYGPPAVQPSAEPMALDSTAPAAQPAAAATTSTEDEHDGSNCADISNKADDQNAPTQLTQREARAEGHEHNPTQETGAANIQSQVWSQTQTERASQRTTRSKAGPASKAVPVLASPAGAGPSQSMPPPTALPAAVAATPLAGVPGSTFTTPAAGMGVPLNPFLAGFSLMKKTVVKGRSRRKQDEAAIMLSMEDGQQFVLDQDLGLTNVPEGYRSQVLQQLEVMMKLADAIKAAEGARR